MDKGAIPIETIAILVIVMIVLIALILFFMGYLGKGSFAIEAQRKFYTQCSEWVAVRCSGSAPTLLKNACALWQCGVETDGTECTTCTDDWIKGACAC